MTVRKPRGTSWESWIDTQIRDARAQGAFDNLPGAGEPLEGLDAPHDEMWWVRSFLKREGLSFLPETLQLKLDVERGMERLQTLHSRREAERILRELNTRILHVNSRGGSLGGPPSTLSPLDVDVLLERWEADRTVSAPRLARVSGPRFSTASPWTSPQVEAFQRAVTLAVFGMLAITLLALFLSRS